MPRTPCRNGVKCTLFLHGKCHFGHNHTSEETRVAMEEYLKELQEKKKIEELRGQIKEATICLPKPEKSEKPVNPLRKTILCDKFQQNGECPYGDACDFAHGEADLLPVPKRKAIQCRFDLMGGCRNPNCDYRHDKPLVAGYRPRPAPLEMAV